MDLGKQELVKAIESLKVHAKVHYPESGGVRTLENVGEHSFVIKLAVFSDFDLNLTIQIPSSYI